MLLSVILGCGDQADIEVLPTLASIQENVFDRSCLDCHGHADPIHGVDLSEGYALENLLYVQSFMEPDFNLIEAGDPQNSLLVRKLRGTAVSAAMPFLRPLLPANRVDAVEEWIANMEPIPQPTLTYLQKNVFDVSCATSGCHDSSTMAEGLDLSSRNSLANMFGIPSVQMPTLDLIEPGDPLNSYLMHKIEGIGLGARMPNGQPPLNQAQIDAVSGWISALEGPQPTLAWVQDNIFDVSCAYSGCHEGADAASGLDLTAGNAIAQTVNIKSQQVITLNLIEPGNADASYLVRKIEGNNILFLRMPWLSPPLSQEKIDAVRQWIDQMPPPIPPVIPAPELSSIQANVFNVSCATVGCHDQTTKTYGLDLSDGAAYNSLVGVLSTQLPTMNLVTPGDPDNSYLISKLEGTGLGSTMPVGQSPLAQAVIAPIRQWIAELTLPQGLEPTLDSIQQNIFTPSCATAGCHITGSPPFGLDLSEGNAYANLVNIASGQFSTLDLVEPGDPDNSYLIRKLEAQGSGALMPLGRPPLPQDEIAIIRQWITELSP